MTICPAWDTCPPSCPYSEASAALIGSLASPQQRSAGERGP